MWALFLQFNFIELLSESQWLGDVILDKIDTDEAVWNMGLSGINYRLLFGFRSDDDWYVLTILSNYYPDIVSILEVMLSLESTRTT